MGNSTSNPDTVAAVVGEDTPLLLDTSEQSSGSGGKMAFRRSTVRGGKPPTVTFDKRSSVRDTGRLFASESQKVLQPIDALAPLVAGGVIVDTDGYTTAVRPPSSVKSLPAFAPFPRMARHRSFHLWWLNEFRHWWKSRYVKQQQTSDFNPSIVGLSRLTPRLCFPYFATIFLSQSSLGAIGRPMDFGCDGHLHGQNGQSFSGPIQAPRNQKYAQECPPCLQNCQAAGSRRSDEILSQLCAPIYSLAAYHCCRMALD